MAFIIVCKHCMDKCSGDYCVKCSSLSKRLLQDEANRINFEENGLSELQSPCKKCKCEIEREIKKSKKEITIEMFISQLTTNLD